MLKDSLWNDLLAAFAEFLGTFMFLFFGLGGVQASTNSAIENGVGISDSPAQLLFIGVSMGFSLLIAVWIFFRVSGGNFNPQVSLALLLTGVLKPVRFILYIFAQTLGALAAVGVLSALLPGDLSITPSLSDGTTKTQGVFIEMFLTAGLCLSVLMLAVEKHKASPMAPVGIGLTLMIGHLVGVVFTGAGMNTARSLAPCVVTKHFPPEHWAVYWGGSSLGSFLAAAIYIFLKSIDYSHLNPGQDSINEEETPIIPAAVYLHRLIFGKPPVDPEFVKRPSIADTLGYMSDRMTKETV